jgi:glycosyltransferase involved in cell wall biosynthesis
LAQSQFYLDQFRKFGFNSRFFPNGVDTKVFSPVGETKKNELRSKYSIPLDKFVILHVGHITPWRSLEIFKELAEDKRNYVLIIGSTSLFRPHVEILNSLRGSGCDIRLEFQLNVEEIYQLSDCFVFPGGSQKQTELPFLVPLKKKVPAIEIPLSILEARSCNLNVVISRFGGLEKCPGSGEGIYFFDSQSEIPDIIEMIKFKSTSFQTNGRIVDYDWKNILTELVKIYEEFKRS